MRLIRRMRSGMCLPYHSEWHLHLILRNLIRTFSTASAFNVRFDILTAVTIQIWVFWDVTPRSFSERIALSVLLQTEGRKSLKRWYSTCLPNWNGITSDDTVISFAQCLSNALRPVSLGSWRKYFSVWIKVYYMTNDIGSSSNRVTRIYYDMAYFMKILHACILRTLRIN